MRCGHLLLLLYSRLSINSVNQIIFVMRREPAVAGSFYPDLENELKKEILILLGGALPNRGKDVKALIVPHAGYVFSGEVAASAFNQLDKSRKYKRVFVIGSAHRNSFAGASVYSAGDFSMPYGVEKVDVSVGEMLYRNNPFLFSSDPGHHEGEHCIEVQLPFLHYVLNPGYRIVPVLLGNVTAQECREIAEALRPWFEEDSLFVISSDFSHYPSYEKATEIDRITMEAIVSDNPDNLVRILEKNESLDVQDLHTSLCGWSSVLTLMYLTSASHAYTYEPLEYRNSGDNALYGDKDNVVGYWSISIYVS